MKRLLAYFSIALGSAILAMWLMLLMGDNLVEPAVPATYHLISEFLMALLCLIGGIFTLAKRNAGALFSLTGLSMALYSVLNAAGYYYHKDTGMFILFNILCVVIFPFILLNLTILNKDM